jgi:POT family proton-dependent oligopeptide transporter
MKAWWNAQTMTGWFKRPNWDFVRPSKISVSERPSWMTYDDAWVDEVRRGLKACGVFLFLPVFHLCYNQMTVSRIPHLYPVLEQYPGSC